MRNTTDAERGWAFAAQLAGVNISADAASVYVGRVEKAIDQLTKDIVKLKSNQSDAQLGGYIAEHWHTGTFNVDAAAADSSSHATALESTAYASVDMMVESTNGVKNYSSKYMATAEDSAVAQATFSRETGQPKYINQDQVVPTDQLSDAKAVAHRRALLNNDTRPEVSDSYRNTEQHLTDRITDDKGVESKSLSKDEDLQIAKEVKKDQFDAEKHGVTTDAAIKPEYIMKQAVKAGLTAAAVTMIMQTAPEIFKAIAYLIKTGELDVNQIKKIGTKAISSGTEGFLRGSIACTLQILCEKGAFGAALKGIDATMLGTVVALTLETVKNSILVAAGKMTPRDMGNALVDNILISTGYVIGAKIGGIIGQALGFELPVMGYLIGSLVGCAFAAVYNIGKKKFISFCIDTGFTCFGLVEQDYTLPEEALRDMGIDITPITRTEVSRTELNRSHITIDINKANIDTIDIRIIRRGIIGVNRIGYVTNCV